MTTLVLLRHAKSAYPPGVPDHDRPLNARGTRDAVIAGQLLGGSVFDLALVSTAVRTRATYDLAAPALSVRQRIDDPELYLAPAEHMLDRIRRQDATGLLVVAHNSGTEDLAALLTADPRVPAYARMCTKFPTAAFAVLRADLPLGQWQPGCADLLDFVVARAEGQQPVSPAPPPAHG